jgi:hypothetical protein
MPAPHDRSIAIEPDGISAPVRLELLSPSQLGATPAFAGREPGRDQAVAIRDISMIAMFIGKGC